MITMLLSIKNGVACPMKFMKSFLRFFHTVLSFFTFHHISHILTKISTDIVQVHNGTITHWTVRNKIHHFIKTLALVQPHYRTLTLIVRISQIGMTFPWIRNLPPGCL